MMKKTILKEASVILIVGTLLMASFAIANESSRINEYKDLIIHEQPVDFNSISFNDFKDIDHVGFYSSLALDNNNYPHISYYQVGNYDLKYSLWNGSAWIIETVDALGDVGLGCSIDLDENDYPHISYLDNSNLCLKYASWNGSAWIIETVTASGDFGWETSLAIDSNGYPHISYDDATNFNLKYATKMGSTWNIETVDAQGNEWQTSIALDSKDYPHIVYVDYVTQGLKYASWMGSTWDIKIADTSIDSKAYYSLAMDSNDLPHISYFNWDKGSLNYAFLDGEVWKLSTIDSYYSNDKQTGRHNSIFLDSNDNPFISYMDHDQGDLKFAYWKGSTWSIETVDSGGTVGLFTSIELDSNNYPHISYYDYGYRNLKYASLTGTGWDLQTVDKAKLSGRLDQENIESCGVGYYLVPFAQSFIPTMDSLEAIELIVWVVGNPAGKGVTISIRSDLDGQDLGSVYLSGDNIETAGWIWYNLDFGGIPLTPGNKYYIVLIPDQNNRFIWEFGYNNPYPLGEAWRYSGSSWDQVNHEVYVDPDFIFKTYGPNDPPGKPTITGNSSGKIDTEYEYTFVAIDPEGDEISYYVDWGDNNNSGWLGPYSSGIEISAKHNWTEQGDYTIKAKVKDPYDAESEWAILNVNVTKSKVKTIDSLFLRFLKNYQILYQILKQLQS